MMVEKRKPETQRKIQNSKSQTNSKLEIQNLELKTWKLDS